MKTIIMSLGGSIIVPDEIDINFLKRFRKLVLDYVKKGNRAVIVCGGGKLARKYNDAAQKLSRVSGEELDWIGIKATIINAELVKSMFNGLVYEAVVNEPNKHISTNKKIIIGSGWKPGWSTDYDAVMLAKQFKADKVINLSNIEYVYDKDPNKYKDAKKIEEISWEDFQKIVGIKYIPNRSWPFDPIASQLAKKWKLEVIIAKGTDLGNLKNVLDGKEFKGTVIR
ncbi:UMP kinase [Candidatus Woesearchaeota archaeon]|nr:UMP kinase [Candidatus Woesearchaeota archaeon]